MLNDAVFLSIWIQEVKSQGHKAIATEKLCESNGKLERLRFLVENGLRRQSKFHDETSCKPHAGEVFQPIRNHAQIWMFPKMVGFPFKSSILIGSSIIYKPSILGVLPYFRKLPYTWNIRDWGSILLKNLNSSSPESDINQTHLGPLGRPSGPVVSFREIWSNQFHDIYFIKSSKWVVSYAFYFQLRKLLFEKKRRQNSKRPRGDFF